MAAMTWDQYLRFLMEVEKENVEENYRIGRAANDLDEEMNADTRTGFSNLQAMMPTLLAAPELLRELKFAVSVLQDNHIARGVAAALAAIRQAEGRTE